MYVGLVVGIWVVLGPGSWEVGGVVCYCGGLAGLAAESSSWGSAVTSPCTQFGWSLIMREVTLGQHQPLAVVWLRLWQTTPTRPTVIITSTEVTFYSRHQILVIYIKVKIPQFYTYLRLWVQFFLPLDFPPIISSVMLNFLFHVNYFLSPGKTVTFS